MKDLNTFINDNLNHGAGLQYQETYWNDMNNLLDTHMPVAQPQHVTGKAIKPTSGTSNRLLPITSLSVILISVAAFFFLPSVDSPKVAIENNRPVLPTESNESLTNPRTQESFHGNNGRQDDNTSSPEQDWFIPNNQATFNQSDNPIKDNGSETLGNQTELSQATTDPHNQNSDIRLKQSEKQQRSFVPSTHAEIRNTPPSPTPINPVSNNLHWGPNPTEEQIKTNQTAFIMIKPITGLSTGSEMIMSSNNQVLPPPVHKHNLWIEHIALSSFAGMVFETGKQTYTSGNIVYTHPTQSHFSYGINLELSWKKFALRTGIGSSTTSYQSKTTNGQDIYDKDTSYILVNPNYGVTPSGKPIALIKQQIDSSYATTQFTTVHQNTGFNYITLPVSLQYHLAFKRYALVIEAGGLHHFRISGNQQPLESGKQQLLPAYNFQFTAGSSLRYALNTQWDIGLQYNYNLNPTGKEIYFLNNSHMGTMILIYNIR